MENSEKIDCGDVPDVILNDEHEINVKSWVLSV